MIKLVIVALLASGVAAEAAAQYAAPVVESPEKLQLRRELQAAYEDRPNIVVPLVFTGAGVLIGVGALYIAGLTAMANHGCYEGECDSSTTDAFLVAAGVGGGIAVLSGIWLTERLFARRAANKRYRELYHQLYGGRRPTFQLALGPNPSVAATVRF
jgi:hypothetical protein